MGKLKSLDVDFPSVVRELLSVRIKDEDFTNPVFEYTITDSDKRICRKGKFNGLEVQLRVAHLNNGKYFFTLSITEGERFVYSFEKKPRQGNDLLEFMAS